MFGTPRAKPCTRVLRIVAKVLMTKGVLRIVAKVFTTKVKNQSSVTYVWNSKGKTLYT